MKVIFTLAALVASALAGNVARYANGKGYGGYPGGGGHGGDDHGGDKGGDKGYPPVVTYGPPVYVPTTKTVDVTYTTECPVTETITYPGTTITTTYTTTSVVYTKIVTTIYETVKGPDVTETKNDVAYTTITSLCPVTETKTVGGSTVYVTYFTTSTIIKEIPATVPVYVTSITTVYETTDILTTVTCPVTTYTTIIQGSTVYVTKTLTKTITYSSAYTVTEVIPVTQTKEVDYTVGVTVGSGATVTQQSLTIIYASRTIVQTQSQAPVTVVQPTTSTSTTAAAVVTAAGHVNNAPVAAFIAGVIGAVVLA